jgi:alpha-tubulin suppressor-like RCC1 family protein
MAVVAGKNHTVVVDEDGSVFAFGGGRIGQLGTGDTAHTLYPRHVGGLPPSSGPVRQVAAGHSHTGIVTEAGDLLMCGWGRHGTLGLGNEADRTTPTLLARAVFDGEAVLMVACGGKHTTVATEGGGVYTFGEGGNGRLGHGDEKKQLAPRRVPAAAFNGERVVMVATGGAHTVALSEAGHVFTWGYGRYGRLGHGDEETQRAPRQVEPGRFGGEKVVFVAAGVNHTAAVTAGGRLYTWGRGDNGELGHGDTRNRLVPTVVGAGAFGAPEGGRVVIAACGYVHTLVVTQDGALWACGSGYAGQLGLSDLASRHAFERLGGTTVVAAAAGYEHSAAVTEDGALWTWGRGGMGQLGHGDVETRLAPTRVAADSLRDTRIGRCRPLPTTHALAFSMGTHGRLGAASPLAALAGEPGLLTMIARAANRWIGGAAGESEALVRLLGGVSVARRRRNVQTTQAGS